MKRALVIGSSGQIGSQVMALLGPDRARGSSRSATSSLRLDLSDQSETLNAVEKLASQAAISSVYCIGAMTDVDGCESQTDLAMRVNATTPGALAELAAAYSLAFVYFSTDYVFDGRDGPYSEESRRSPICVYGKSKSFGEELVSSKNPAALIIRTTVVFGPDPRNRGFLSTLSASIKSGRPLRVATDQFSTPTYSRDIAAATLALVENGEAGLFHVSGPETISRYDFAVRAATAMGLSSRGIVGVSTAELGQVAVRPLRAGLVTTKLNHAYPQIRPRPLEQCIIEWQETVACDKP